MIQIQTLAGTGPVPWPSSWPIPIPAAMGTSTAPIPGIPGTHRTKDFAREPFRRTRKPTEPDASRVESAPGEPTRRRCPDRHTPGSAGRGARSGSG